MRAETARRWVAIAILILPLTCVLNPSTAANAVSSRLRSLGDELEYNLDLPDALTFYRQAVDAEPDDPAAYRAVAATAFFQIAFRRGAVAADEFLGGEVNVDTIEMPKPPPELASAFRENAQRALDLAEQYAQAQPNGAEAHYQVGTTIGLLASYSATVDGRILAAFKYARRGYKENSRALELDPTRHDAGLIVGTYQYIVATRAFPVRWFARMAGVESNKAHGIQLIEAAARYPGENQTDAQLVLMLIYNRERRYDDALRVLRNLQSRYPRNRLLWLEAGATELRAQHFEMAEQLLNEGFAKFSEDPRPRAFGEEALWHYKRGAVRVRLRRIAEAAADLRAALTGDARGWVRGRAHAELGRLADLEGDHRRALLEYRTAVQLAKTAADSIGIADAEQLLSRR
jgi:tetratricopeptide (TPR) repeat protein